MEKVDILGIPYEIIRDADTAEYPILDIRNAIGYAEVEEKKIIIGDIVPEPGSTQDVSTAVEETMRHEIVHGYTHETGLYFSSDEEEERIVTWIARMFPRLLKSFRETGCSGEEGKKADGDKS